MRSARWVRAPLAGQWLSAWLQNESAEGYWVQFDPDGPYRLVEEIEEVSPMSGIRRRDPRARDRRRSHG